MAGGFSQQTIWRCNPRSKRSQNRLVELKHHVTAVGDKVHWVWRSHLKAHGWERTIQVGGCLKQRRPGQSGPFNRFKQSNLANVRQPHRERDAVDVAKDVVPRVSRHNWLVPGEDWISWWVDSEDWVETQGWPLGGLRRFDKEVLVHETWRTQS